MADPAFHFNKDLFGGQAVALTAESDAEPDVLQALRADQPFPDRSVTLGRVRLASSASQVAFHTEAGAVALDATAGGGAFAALGVYTDPHALLGDLTPQEPLAPAFSLEADAASRFLLLRMGYDLNASARGSLPLGARGSVTFGADGRSTGLFAVIRRIDRMRGARTALTDLAQRVRLPHQVQASDDLDPGTWLVTEVDGAVDVQLGAQLGFDFSWVRRLAEGALGGDVGLRLQLGVATTLGFSAAGSYLVALGRPTESPALRLRLFKLARKGWTFALSTHTDVQGRLEGLPDRFDDFVAAVFGVNHQQILHDLLRWTDTGASLPDLVGGAGVDYARSLLRELTGIDPEQAFDRARAEVAKLGTAWRNLPARVATTVADLVGEAAEQEDLSDELDAVRRFLQDLAGGSRSDIEDRIRHVLADVAFFQTPAGRWLEAVSAEGVLSLLDRVDLVRDVAARTLQVLDGGAVQQLLTRLQKYIDEHLSLDAVQRVVDQTTFDGLDAWLKARLSVFLGKTLDLAGLEKIRTTIDLLLSKRQVFYEKALAALRQRYALDGALTYQRSDTGTALLDATFDGSPEGLALLRRALDGDFSSLLTGRSAALTLNAATLTHATERRQHVELTLPFFEEDVDRINEALARVDAVDHEDGRVLVYTLEARDAVTRAGRRAGQHSVLAVGANLPLRLGNRTRVYDPGAFTYTYSFDQAVVNMRTGALRYQLKPYVSFYFPSAFGALAGDAARASFDTWLADLDKTIDRLEPGLAATDLFGNTLLSLRLSLPGRVAGAWLKAPSDEKAFAYMEMARRLQRQLKQLIPFYYFQEVGRYDDLIPAEALLVYAAIPASTSIRLQGGEIRLNTDRETYWNWPDAKERRAMALAARPRLAADLQRVNDRLTAAGRPDKAKFYTPQAAATFVNDALQGHGSSLLESLLFVEAVMVKEAVRAGRDLAAFLAGAEQKPAKAVETLAAFGRRLTKAFHERVASVYGGEALRPLGTMLFAEAACALDAGAAALRPRALLDLTVLKPGVAFPPAGFPNHSPSPREEVVIRQRIVEGEGTS